MPAISHSYLENSIITRLDFVRDTQIHEMTNTQPLINTVRQRQLCFLGRIPSPSSPKGGCNKPPNSLRTGAQNCVAKG